MDDRDDTLRRINERHDVLVRAMKEVSAISAKERQLLKEQREALAEKKQGNHPQSPRKPQK